jgi:CHAT domain-containing protein
MALGSDLLMRLSAMLVTAFACEAIPSLSRAILVTASPSCGAAWIAGSDRVAYWHRLNSTEGILTVGPEIIARLAFEGNQIEIRSRDHPLTKLPGTIVAQDAEPALLNIEAQLPINRGCNLSLRGLVRTTSNPDLAAQATAYLVLGTALDAEATDDRERAGELAAEALRQLPGADPSEFPQKLDFAAFAIEKLLDAERRDQATQILAMVLDDQVSNLPPGHPSKLRFQLAQARALSFSDQNDQALKLRLALQPLVSSTFAPLSDESLSNQVRIANLKLELGNYTQARIELEALNKSISRNRKPGDPIRVSVMRALANALGFLGLARDSVEMLGRFRGELAIAYGQSDGRVIDVDDQISRLRIRLDELELALQGSSKVFLWRSEHLGFSNVRTLRSAWTLALLYKELGRYDTARALIYALLDASRHTGNSPPKQLTLKTLATLGSIEASDGNIEAAEEILRSVWQEYAAILGENSIDTEGALVNYALLLVQNGRMASICSILKEKLDKNWTGLHPDMRIKAFSQVLFGLCLLENAQSGPMVQEGLAKIEGAWSDLKARGGASSYSAMYALSALAWANYQYGDRRTAKAHLQALVGFAEQFRRATPTGSYTRDFWFSKWIVDHSKNLGYRTLALLHAEDGELDEALRISELARDRRLRDRFLERDWLSAKLPREVHERLRTLAGSVHTLDEQLALEDRVVERVNLESRRTLAVAERDDIERDAVRRYKLEPLYVRSPTSAQLRALLPAGTAVASIQRSGDRWWAIVIGRDSPNRLVMLDADPDLGLAARGWVKLLGGEPARTWPTPENRLTLSYERPAQAMGSFLSREELAQRLGRDIIDPLLSAAPGARRLVVVADDELSGVPFGALPIQGTFAADRLDVTYAPSLGTYAALRRSTDQLSWSRDLFSIAVDNVMEPDSMRNAGLGTYSHDTSMRSALEYASDHPLPFAAKEVETVAQGFSQDRVAIFHGLQASKATLMKASDDGSLRSYRYVHFAAHAFSFPSNPERSMLVLNSPDADGAAGRVLTAVELSNLKMGSELIVLSACGTAAGRYEQGQGLLGFAFAALAAGNHAALLSLWEVTDDLTQRFMASFYERLQHGMQPLRALGATQREFAHDPNPRINDPSTWGAFVLYGGS